MTSARAAQYQLDDLREQADSYLTEAAPGSTFVRRAHAMYQLEVSGRPNFCLDLLAL